MNRCKVGVALGACLALFGSPTVKAAEPLPVPEGPVEQAAGVVQGVNTFAADLYRQLAAGQKGNLLCSPASVDTALAMTYAGAAGRTATQMATVLHYDLQPALLHPAFARLIESLNSGGGKLPGQSAYQLVVANALWGQDGYPFKPAFSALVQQMYGAGLNSVDFAGHPEDARQTINFWVAGKTADKIKDLIGPGVIDPRATRLILTNAVYFKSNWMHRFPASATKDGPFTTAGGTPVTAPMMHLTGHETFGYLENEDLQVLELPYESDALSMLIFLPRKPDGLPALEQTITAANLGAWTGHLDQALVNITLPRFMFASQFDVGQTLAAMGMADAFSSRADFSGMTSAENPSISAVIHKAFVAVDEDGTEAAAATGVGMAALAMRMGQPKDFVADHPFVFLIRHRETGCILFIGKVENPVP
jgi:serpin B